MCSQTETHAKSERSCDKRLPARKLLLWRHNGSDGVSNHQPICNHSTSAGIGRLVTFDLA